MTEQDYINEWKEVKDMTEGKTMADIREMFKTGITNDIPNGYGADQAIIDTNYKHILVTFIEKDGNATLHNWVETYADNGYFLGVIIVKE